MKKTLTTVALALGAIVVSAGTASALPESGSAGPLRPAPKSIPQVLFEAPYGNVQDTPIREVAGNAENQASLQNFTNTVGAAGAAGTVAGGVIGFGVGCAAGAALGLPLAIVPGALGGCLVGGAAGAGIGAAIGSVGAGGIAGLAAGADVVATHAAPEGTTHWAK